VPTSSENLPLGNSVPDETIVRTAADIGALARDWRKQQGMKQADVAGVSGSGNRFIVDLESGKPTLQLQKTLDVLQLLGLEVVVRPKTDRGVW